MKSPTTDYISSWISEHYSLKCTAKKLAGEVDYNYYLKSEEGSEYILKIAAEDTDRNNLLMQNAMVGFLASKAPKMALPQILPNFEGKEIGTFTSPEGEIRMQRLLSWVPGKLWSEVNPHSENLLHSLGTVCGLYSKHLQGFDHEAGHRWFKWDVQETPWVEKDFSFIADPKQREKAEFFLQLFKERVLPLHSQLRQSIIHNDANDYNILVNAANETVRSLIDFGDAIYSYTVNELAIAMAYACMGKEDPLEAAVHILKGFHNQFPLTEEEIHALFPLVCGRLLISVTCSARNKHEHPENEYLLISERPAWKLLDKLYQLSPNFIEYRFREVCGFTPHPKETAFRDWTQHTDFSPLFKKDIQTETKHIFDLGVGSLELGNNSEFDSTESFDKKVIDILDAAKTELGIGKYDEIRPVYTTDAYEIQGNNGSIWRTLHIGLDVFLPAETEIYAPFTGKVHSFQNNDFERDYGPTIILEHEINEDLTFYTLYGHLSLDSIEGLGVGQRIEQGDSFARIGNREVNGMWPPHLHFQIMLDMLGKIGDFPGVVFPHQRKTWLSICPDPQVISGKLYQENPKRKKEKLLEKRKAHLGKNLSLSYKKPLHMERAYLQYLYANDGRRYLDTVNNVPHVGHQHPRVVQAAQKQIAILNTNTRYLHDQIISFAEELTAIMPDPLSVAFFVNSGSEANELALRMARTYTQQKDILVVDVGYHGNTQACIEISPYKFNAKGGKGPEDFIHITPMPDGYRGIYGYEDEKAGEKYAAHIQEKIKELQAKGKGLAAFIHESILSCGGQIVLPPNYLKHAYQIVREAGGICIADEVQVGFGRVGDKFWGFELQGVVPDIVSMGKPIGNGHPLGAVVCRPEIAEAFANGMEYFNTFGGNPVSCTIGREVLKIVQEDKLQAHAKKMGNILLKGLRELQRKHPIIGDVRGHGLFLGFEMVKDRESKEPAAAACSYLANRMRERGILMSVDGPLYNVIKIKPPLAFGEKHAAILLENLSIVFQEDQLQL
ncbi:MAG: aminotransferase class III-fold pyridoxal phosphate-dependent enzyme [Bacteroidota bacterium]